MVTKLDAVDVDETNCLILAKNHMVTKHIVYIFFLYLCLILAKNHMVTKRMETFYT